MGVKVEVLIPGVQDRGEADLGLKALIVPGKLEQSLGGRVKEEIKNECLVAPGQGLEVVGQGDHQVEVGNGQKPLQALRQPSGLLEALALGTVAVAAGVVGDRQVAAAPAADVHVSAQTGGAAAFDIPHGLMLRRAEAMVFPVVRAMVAKDLGHLQGWSGHASASSRGGLDHIQGTHQFLEQPVGNVGVTQGGTDGTVAQEDLQDADVGAGLQQVGGKAVALMPISA